MIFRTKSTLPIKVVSTVKGLSDIEVIAPKPANKFIPNWWKDTPTRVSKMTSEHLNQNLGAGNVKTCPSFPDYFASGIVIPMWADVLLRYDPATEEWMWQTPSPLFSWEIHSNNQFLDHVPFKYFGKSAKFIFKAISPWKIITPPGYSVYQQPLFYHFDTDFTVLPGVIDTDIHHAINQQVVFLSDKKEFLIKRGTPFVQYIPFKRETLNLEVRDSLPEDDALFLKDDLYFQTKFLGSRTHLLNKKERFKETDDE